MAGKCNPIQPKLSDLISPAHINWRVVVCVCQEFHYRLTAATCAVYNVPAIADNALRSQPFY